MRRRKRSMERGSKKVWHERAARREGREGDGGQRTSGVKGRFQTCLVVSSVPPGCYPRGRQLRTCDWLARL